MPSLHVAVEAGRVNNGPVSPKLRGELTDATEAALNAIRTTKVVEYVTVIRGYLELSVQYPGSQYLDNVRRSLVMLSDVAETRQEAGLSARLRSLARQLE